MGSKNNDMIKENKTSDNTIRYLIVAGELFAMNMALLSLYWFYYHTSLQTPPHYKRLMLLMTLVYIVCERTFPSRLEQRFVRGDQMYRMLITGLASFVSASLLVLWVFRWPLMTWQFMLPFYGAVAVFVTAYRWIMRHIIKAYRQHGRNSMTVLFVGNINIASDMYKGMKQERENGFRVLGYFSDEPYENLYPEDHMGKPEDVLEYINGNKHIHNIYCMLPSAENPLINKIIDTCENNMIRYNHIPDSFNYKRHNMAFQLMAGTPIFSIHYEPLTFVVNRMVKRIFDIVFSLLVLTLLFPWVYIIVGTLIKLSSPGPIFFRQKRSGMEGKDFDCLKFRSMKVNTESDTMQATKDDPRKTRIGEFIRKTSIDELPQFINVLRGEMSVVGPRPHMLRHTEEYSKLIGGYMVRHFAKPGITGWAQVTGSRGETQELWQMEERVKKDIWYIEHWSMALDLYIIIRTVKNAVHGEQNAY